MVRLKIISVNVRGLGTQHKRRDVMHYLKDMNCDILLLQDTHLPEKKVPEFNYLWRGKAYHSCYRNCSRGTSILINSRLQHEVLREFVSNEGNYIIIHCKIEGDSYVIGSIYGPNTDKPHFYECIDEVLESCDYEHVVIGGDFNFVINTEYDCYGYVRENNINAKNKFVSICNKHNLVDIWRQQNPRAKEFTWFTHARNKGSRLDMFFVSNHLSRMCSDIHIRPGYRTDHNIITMCLQAGESQRGPGLWKFNESLLNDENYIDTVNDCISRTIEQYALPIYTREYLSDKANYENIHLQINDDLFYETLLMMIRGETVQYSKFKAKQWRAKEKELLEQVASADAHFSYTNTEEDAAQLTVYKEQLEEIRKPLIEGLIIRSRTRWHEKGEKSSKYFLGLEKRNGMRKTINVLKEGNELYTRASTILHKFTEHISKKYGRSPSLSPTSQKMIADNIPISLTSTEREILEQPLSFKELEETLQHMKKGKSPGSNGYTACFFRRFWRSLGPFLFRAFVFCTQNGKMLQSHREGIITMIPKAGKSHDTVKGWRPITLLNVDFKIISAAVAKRLQSVANKLIDPCQTAYMKGRFIGENTRLIYDVINNVLDRGDTGLVMSADFEAAFDSLSWNFVGLILKHYGFGMHFRELINTLYMNTDNFSRIIINGYLGEKINFKCGIRQGDPASGYIFNLAVNILAQQIKQSKILTGINVDRTNEVRISQYADDTVLFLNNSPTCLKGALQELKAFSEVSGLRLNIEKSSCMQIGNTNQQHRVNDHGIRWVNSLKILGITFTNDNNNITKNNLEPKILQIEREIAQWRRRNITPMGRITVIKSLLISKCVHLFTSLPNPTKAELKHLENILFNFLWGSKRDPVKRAKIVQNYSNGGLRMLDLQAFVQSRKISWLKRLYTTSSTWSTVIANNLPNIDDIFTYGNKKLLKICLNVNNQFWRDVLEAFAAFSEAFKPDLSQILSEGMWFNDYTKFKLSVIHIWNRNGIRFLADLVNENTGTLHSKESLENAFNIKMTFLCFSSLMKSLPDELKAPVIFKEQGPVIPLRMNMTLNHTNFPRLAYDILIENKRGGIKRVNQKQKDKWLRDVGCFDTSSTAEVMKATKSTHIGMFQYKLANRIIATNKYLKIIKVRDDDRCTFCNEETETLTHVFWHCATVQSFIDRVKSWLSEEYNISINLNSQTWFFPSNLKAREICVITLAKMVIYEVRLKQTLPNIIHLKNKLKREITVEFQASLLANKQDIFRKKWGPMKNLASSPSTTY